MIALLLVALVAASIILYSANMEAEHCKAIGDRVARIKR